MHRAICAVVLLMLMVAQVRADDRPNIVIIMADDMGYSDVGCFGSEIRTPNIDALAQNGLRFTQFYNDARCCPTRASLLTGVYPHQAGMANMVSPREKLRSPGPNQGYLNDRTVTIAEVLRQAGYRTYMSGKWHVGEHPDHWPRKRGFERYFGLISGASSYYEIIADQPRLREMAEDDKPFTPDPESGFYMTDAFSDRAVRFINEHYEQSPDQPMLLYLAYTAPHWPLHAPEEDTRRYLGKYMIGWDVLRQQRFQRMRRMGILGDRHVLSEREDSVSQIPAWSSIPVAERREWDRRMAVYAAMIDRMDQSIGRVVQTLKAHDALDNTLILFVADNGGCDESVEGRKLHDPNVPIGLRGSYEAYLPPWANASNTPFRNFKSYTHEGGIATPMIAHWPKGIREKGRIVREFGHVTDFMATAVELAQATYPEKVGGKPIHPLVGRSLAPLFKGEKREGHERYFWEHSGAAAMREGPWKLVRPRGRKKSWELYNLDDDPTELHNLAADHPDRVKTMSDTWNAWHAEVMKK